MTAWLLHAVEMVRLHFVGERCGGLFKGEGPGVSERDEARVYSAL